MRLGDRVIEAGGAPYVIAELGVNHDGSVARALELVRAAHAAGADAVKLQLFQAGQLLGREARLAVYQRQTGADDPFEMLRALEMDVAGMQHVVALAHEHGLHAIVTVFSVELVQPALALQWQACKTASPDVVNRPLIEALMATGLPLLVSAGASTLEEVARATRWLGGHPHVMMQCVSAYPSPDESASLAARHAMLRVNPMALGYSDHTTGVDTGALAVASGACVLEKHLTLDRSAAGPDHAASLEPAQFAEYVRLAQRAHAMLGPAEKNVLAIERDVHEVSRQSLTARADLAPGHVLTARDIAIKRPGTGLPPARLHEVVGRRLARAVQADTPLRDADLA